MELLSVFDTPELYTVFAAAHELGVLHELSFRREHAIVLLGGRSWRVSSVDHKHRIAHVEPAEDLPGRSTWLGSSQGLSFEICQSMRQVLLNSNAGLSRRAAEQMELLVAQGTTDPAATILRATRTGRMVDLCRPESQRRPGPALRSPSKLRQPNHPGAILPH